MKLLKWVGIAFVIYFVVKNPVGAAQTVQAIGAGLAAAADSAGAMLASLAS
jgi:hypothetical protein